MSYHRFQSVTRSIYRSTEDPSLILITDRPPDVVYWPDSDRQSLVLGAGDAPCPGCGKDNVPHLYLEDRYGVAQCACQGFLWYRKVARTKRPRVYIVGAKHAEAEAEYLCFCLLPGFHEGLYDLRTDLDEPVKLGEADVVILLVTTRSLTDMAEWMAERQDRHRVLPVLLTQCHWDHEILATNKGQPVHSHADWTCVVEEILQAIEAC